MTIYYNILRAISPENGTGTRTRTAYKMLYIVNVLYYLKKWRQAMEHTKPEHGTRNAMCTQCIDACLSTEHQLKSKNDLAYSAQCMYVFLLCKRDCNIKWIALLLSTFISVFDTIHSKLDILYVVVLAIRWSLFVVLRAWYILYLILHICALLSVANCELRLFACSACNFDTIFPYNSHYIHYESRRIETFWMWMLCAEYEILRSASEKIECNNNNNRNFMKMKLKIFEQNV